MGPGHGYGNAVGPDTGVEGDHKFQARRQQQQDAVLGLAESRQPGGHGPDPFQQLLMREAKLLLAGS